MRNLLLLLIGGVLLLVFCAASSPYVLAQDGAAASAPVATSPTEKEFSPVQSLAASLTIFVLAVFVGFEVITKVPPTLHTPLMSGSNAISGITIVGAIVVTGLSTDVITPGVGLLAVVLAMVNVVGGFLVTHRMLNMFRRK
jgi:NAD(P) transhydrogenase subunit alpha